MIATEIGTACAEWIGVLAFQSLYATLVFAVVLGLSVLLRRRFPALQLALWSLVFLRLVLPVELGHPLSIAALAGRIGNVKVSQSAVGLDESSLQFRIANSSVPKSVENRAAGREWAVLTGIVWLAGVLGSLVGYARRRLVLRRVLRRAVPITDERVLELAEHWSRRFGIRRRVRLLSSAATVGPFTTGIVTPVIFIPRPIVEGEALEPVIAHEMAHVTRWDSLWLAFEHAIRMVYFFHPAVWIAAIRIDRERERICDAMVLAGGAVSARAYAGGLLDVLQLNLPGIEVLTLISAQRGVHMRIQNILESSGRKPRAALALAVAFALGCVLLPMRDGHAGAPVAEPIGTGLETAPADEGPPSASRTFTLNDPLPGARVTRGWGESRDPFTGNEIFHRGIDLAAKTGTPILAAAAGVVEVATTELESEPSAGTVVLLRHSDGFSTYYSHLGTLEVHEGQEVSDGDVIATVGSTGKSTGPHLHFEIRENGEALNPAEFVDVWKRQ